MRVLVDLTYILPDHITGVANYAFWLFEGIAECNYQNFFTFLVTHENVRIVEERLPQYRTIVFNSRSVPYIRGLLNVRKLNQLLQKERVDLFFSPYLAYTGLYATSVPFIGVLHDAQGFELMKNPLKQFLYDHFTKYILNKLTQLVTISEFSKRDIQHKLPAFNLPITVIYNSVKVPNGKISSKKSYKVPYILNVNTLEPYKNLITLIKAFDLVKDIIPHKLIVKAAIRPYWNEVIMPYIKEHKLEDRIQLICVEFSENEMAELYANADLFVSPSLMEGFGYTPIEAALYQIPVVCSKESALYETTMGLLNYYEPAIDADALKVVMLEVLHNPPLNLKAIAQKYLCQYSPKMQAQRFMYLFENQIYNK